jgi:ligand-binding sensor domain-containing protein
MGGKKGLYTPQGVWETKFGEVFDVIRHKETIWIASETGVYSYPESIDDVRPSVHTSFPKDATMLLHEDGFRLQSDAPFILGKQRPDIWTRSSIGWHPVLLEGAWLDIALDGTRVWSLNEKGVWLNAPAKKTSKLLYSESNLKEIAVSSLSIWGRSIQNKLIRLTLGKRQEYNIPSIVSMSAGKSNICIGTQKGLYRIWINAKKPIEQMYKKHKFSAVYSTKDGDCWFASTGDQVGVVYADGREVQWDTPSRIGKVYSLRPQGEKGLWVHSNKGLWLMRKRVP